MLNRKKTAFHYHLMLLPGMVMIVLFSFIPMLGAVIAFQDFNPGRGFLKSEWVGLKNFVYMFELNDSRTIFVNTISIAVMKIAGHLVIPLVFSLLLHELSVRAFKRWVQTIVYLPHFFSWVILSGIIIELLSMNGPVNSMLKALGGEPILFLGSNSWFPGIVVMSDIWKEFGFETIIYLAALTAINPTLYEAADIDGANRLQKMFYVTLPGITATIVLLSTLSLGGILNAGFDQIFNLYNPLVYSSGDIIDTYVYRIGIMNYQYGLATAVGMLKSVVALALIVISYKLASRYANYRIF